MTQIHPISVSMKEAARLMGVSVWTIRRRCEDGSIESRWEEKRRLVDYASLQTYIKGLPTERPEATA